MDVRVTIEENGERYEPEPRLTKLEKIELIVRYIFGVTVSAALFIGMPWGTVVYLANDLYQPGSLSFIWSSLIISVVSLPGLVLIAGLIVFLFRWFPEKGTMPTGRSMTEGLLTIFLPLAIGPIIYYVLLRLLIVAIGAAGGPDVWLWLNEFTGSRAATGATLALTSFQFALITIIATVVIELYLATHYD